jgi:hypothetical protein
MACLSLASPAFADDIEKAPIHYATAPVDNVVSRLLSRIEAGKTELTREEGFGYLRSLLRELKVPESSQVLVFSKTSLQRQRIGPRTPRAIYFNDDVYIGFCRQGDVAEISAVDPQLGTVFYTLDQRAAAKPKLTRQTEACLICHASSQNEGFPGHLLRSVYPDAEGYPELAAGTYRIDQRSPLKERWGGWYVSGSTGGQPHLGNRITPDRNHPRRLDDEPARDLTDLRPVIDTSAYLTAHSDVAALMVLEHQTEMHNLIARAALQTRLALHQESELNREMGNPADYRFESTTRRIRSAGDALLQYMLFAGEPRLAARIEGTSSFAREFVRRGPRDSQGHSLRDLNLHSRLFSYPCSYLIYSPAFDALPQRMHDYVLERLWKVLTGKDSGVEFAHLSPDDRKAILQILRETKSGLPKYWYAAG